MKKSYLAMSLLVAALVAFSKPAFAQESNDSRVISVFIMEDVLFNGITANTPAELLQKKIQRVNASLADPVQQEANAYAEEKRKMALVQLRTRLEEQKNKLNTNTSK